MNLKFKTTGISAALAAGMLVTAPAIADPKIGGRIMVDAVAGSDSDDGTTFVTRDGTEFRRLRAYMKGAVSDDVKYKFQFDISDNNLDIKDAYIGVKMAGGELRVGQFKMAGGLEELTSSKYITMMERTMLSSLFPIRRIGAAYFWKNDAATVQANIFGQEAGDGDQDQEGLGVSARGTMAFGNAEKGLFHIGGTAVVEQPGQNGDTDDTFKFDPRPENHLSATKPLSIANETGPGDLKTTLGVEGAFVAGPFAAQAEVVTADAGGDDSSTDVDVLAYAVTASYFFNGHKVYKGGKFARPKITGKNAVEVAARYSTFGTEQGTADEDLSVLTLGVSYYLNAKTRLMLNYGMAEYENSANADEDSNFVMSRFQVDF